MASTPPPRHVCRLVAAPWDGVHVTDLDSGRHFGRHWHDTFGVGVLVDGAQRSASGRGAVEARPGDVITTNPGEVHDGRPLGSPSRRWRMLYLSPAALREEADRADLVIERPVMQDPALAVRLHRLFDHVAAGHPPLAVESAFVEACARLLGRHGRPRRAAAVDAAMVCVAERLAAGGLPPPTLAELAALTGLSRFQVLRRFGDAHGVPPHAWLVLRRTERARALIARGLSLAEAAATAGFADQSHMTRAFSRQFGFTPGLWREAHRARPPAPAEATHLVDGGTVPNDAAAPQRATPRP